MKHFACCGQILAFLGVLAAIASPAAGQETPSLVKILTPPAFSLPIDCTPGTDCWVMTYPDLGGQDGVPADPLCGPRTFDGHQGTDFAIRDAATMVRGVDVRAAMGGKIIRVRDGEDDRWASEDDIEQTRAAKKECGNAVMIDHGNNLFSVYCHLKKNSVAIKRDTTVKEGQKIGEVGLSGETYFPHLHFGVIRNGKMIDPFTGAALDEKCAGASASLWKKNAAPAYEFAALYAGGFADKVPEYAAIERDASTPDSLSRKGGTLVFWFAAFALEAGDHVSATITAPDGRVIAARNFKQGERRARQMHYLGVNDADLAPGVYRGEAIVTRHEDSARLESSVTLID